MSAYTHLDFSSILEKSTSYRAYVTKVMNVHQEGRTTDGRTDEAYLNYTKMGIRKMDRLGRKGTLLEDVEAKVSSTDQSQIWLTITEGWCPDAAQILPFLDKMAMLNDHIDLRIVLREEHPKLMDAFLTNGSRSIPKVVILDQHREVLQHWGPRPQQAQEIVLRAIQAKSETRDGAIKAMIDYDKNKDLQTWYQKDKGVAIQEEFLRQIL